QGRQARDSTADDQEPQSGGLHSAWFGVRRRQRLRESRLFGADLRPYRLNGHALLGRPGERNHLRRAHVVAAPRGATPPARSGGGARRRGRPPLNIGCKPSPRLPFAREEEDFPRAKWFPAITQQRSRRQGEGRSRICSLVCWVACGG